MHGPYYICTGTQQIPKSLADSLQAKIVEIDETAALITAHIPGNNTRWWVERPGDGTNDYNHVRERSNRIRDLVTTHLAGVK